MEHLRQVQNMRTLFTRQNCFLTILLFCYFYSMQSSVMAQPSEPNSFTIVIDAGHGGKDPGAVGKKSYEKNIALAIARKLGYYIDKSMPEVKVIYTRKTDVFIDLDVRASIANRVNADLFLSIHVDGIGTPNAYGTSTYVMGITKNETNLALAKKENSAIEYEQDYSDKYQGFDPGDLESNIIFQLAQQEYQDQSLNMASMVQNQFRNKAKRRDRGVHPAPFLVLWKATMPRILIETGFITNPKEEAFLNTDYGQDLIAHSIFTAFKEYKTKTDARTVSIVSGESNKIDFDKISTQERKEEPPFISTNVVKSEFVFRVQILASTSKIPKTYSVFKGYKTFEEFREGAYYKYLSPPKKTYSEAQKIRKDLVKSFPGAFIVAFRNGKKISLQEAIEEDKKIH